MVFERDVISSFWLFTLAPTRCRCTFTIINTVKKMLKLHKDKDSSNCNNCKYFNSNTTMICFLCRHIRNRNLKNCQKFHIIGPWGLPILIWITVWLRWGHVKLRYHIRGFQSDILGDLNVRVAFLNFYSSYFLFAI